MGKGDVDYRSPIYLQLREIVREKIEDGEYPPGTAIPSENDLAEIYGINRLTVRNAVDTLVSEGLLKRVQGKGVYVLGEKVERDLDTLAGFSRTMLDKKVKPSTEIFVKALRPAGGKYSKIFGIGEKEEIYFIKRVNYANDVPCSLENIYIPKYVMPKLDGIDLSVFSLYEVYDFYKIKMRRAEQTLDLTCLEQSDARTLGIDASRSVLLFTSVSYDERDRAIEFTRNYTRADICDFQVNFRAGA